MISLKLNLQEAEAKLKILYLTEFFPTTLNLDVHGGIETRTYAIGKLLSSRHEVYVLAAAETGKPMRQELAGIKVRRVGWSRQYSRRGAIGERVSFIISAIWQGLFWNFDLVEGSGFLGWLPAYILGVVKRKKKVILVADLLENYASDTPKLAYKAATVLEKYLLNRPWERIICISQVIKEKLLKKHILSKKISVIYCGAEVQRIQKLESEKKQIFTIGCVSRLVPYKRGADLIRAIHILRSDKNLVECEIVGDGEELPNLKQLVKDLKLTRFVHLRGFVESHQEVIKIVKSCQVFCLPSVVEGFGISTIEALSAGLPVVLADIPISHEVTENQAVLYFKPGDYRDLARQLHRLLSDQQLYQKLARETGLSNKYDWKQIARETENLYENLCTS